MPLTGQHSLRIIDSKKMDKGSFRTTAGGTLFGGSVKVPTTINIIWAKLIGKAKPSDPPMLQSLKFPVAKGWTEDKTKLWIADNGMTAKGKFEKAKVDKKSDQSKDTDKFSEKGNISTFLQATIHGAFSRAADTLLGNGIITSEQRIAASNSIGTSLNTFRSELETKFPEAKEIIYPRNKEDRVWFVEDNILEVFDSGMESVSGRYDEDIMKPPMKANDALEMDDVDLGAMVREMLKNAMDRKRISLQVFEQE